MSGSKKWVKQLVRNRFKKVSGVLVAFVIVFLMVEVPATSALAASTNVGSYFRASYSKDGKKVASLVAEGRACKKYYSGKGYKVKSNMKVTSITAKFPSSQKFNAYVSTDQGGGVNGPSLSVKVGAKSTTPLTRGYLTKDSAVYVYIYSQTLSTGSSATTHVKSLATCG